MQLKRSIPGKTDVAAAEVEMDVLRLPVGHCKLNPIELVWANVKHYTLLPSTETSQWWKLNVSQRRDPPSYKGKLGQMCQTHNINR